MILLAMFSDFFSFHRFINARSEDQDKPSYCAAAYRCIILLLCAASLSLCLSSCGQAPQNEYGGSTLRTTSCPPSPIGEYHAQSVSGDYADYPNLQEFIDMMVGKHGFDRQYLMGLFSQVKRQNWTLNYLTKADKAVKVKPTPGGWDRYLAKFLDERHIGAGVVFANRYHATLQRATRLYGVPEEYILGILGVETNFGGYLGSQRMIDALTTLGFDYARRGKYFRAELQDFLLLTRDEGVDPGKPIGSYAGAMGLCQFMPGSFLRWAIDFNGDGRRDLLDPEDAIGSVANYLAQHGWQPGQPVTGTLRVTRAVKLESGLETRYSLSDLQHAGLQSVGMYNSRELFSLLVLHHKDHDQYLTGYPNFHSITRYNHSVYYAMAVQELGQAIEHRLQPEAMNGENR